ncbi:MAG: ankyrin repeat domain-containing protein [Candidatus Hydrogenedentes bacterium]|nr:ankyrin repeat domain-containing protein [Candidatus Hydrogenedentota bacterium]
MNTKHRLSGVLAIVILGFAGLGCGGTEIPGVADDSNRSAADQFIDAAYRGDVAKMKTLLAQDATLVKAHGERGTTPLLEAARAGQNGAVQLLLEHGADPMARDEAGDTPGNAAMVERHPDTAKIIAEAMNAKRGAAAQ